MIRLLSLAVVAAALLGSLTACSDSSDSPTDETISSDSSEQQTERVRAVFEEYRASVRVRDGEAAADLVSESTLTLFREMGDLALYADLQELRSLPANDALTALMLRGLVHAGHVQQDSLQEMTGRELFTLAIASGLTGNVEAPRIREVPVDAGIAHATVDSGAGTSSLRWRFERQNDRWKLDLTAIWDDANRALGDMLLGLAASEERSEDEVLLLMVSQALSAEFDQTLFEPLSRRG